MLPSLSKNGGTFPTPGGHHNQVHDLAICDPFDDCCRIAIHDPRRMAYA